MSEEQIFDQLFEEVESYILLNVLPSSEILSRENLNNSLDLLDISGDSLDHLVKVHFVISTEVERIQKSLRNLLYNMELITERETEESPFIRGHVDWGKTLKLQMISYGSPKYACKIPQRQYDTSYNQLIKFVLISIKNIAEGLLLNYRRNVVENDNEDLINKIESLRKQIFDVLKMPAIKGITEVKHIPYSFVNTAKQLKNSVYKDFASVYELYDRFFIRKDYTSIREKLLQKILRPKKKDTDVLFELVVLFRTISALDNLCILKSGRRIKDVIGCGIGQVAQVLIDDIKVTINYQSLDKEFYKKSKYKDYFVMLGIDNSRSRRPDILISFEKEGMPRYYVLIEAKFTQNNRYFADSIYKMFGYMYDFDSILQGDIKATLVTYKDFGQIADESKPLWITDYVNMKTQIRKLFEYYSRVYATGSE